MRCDHNRLVRERGGRSKAVTTTMCAATANETIAAHVWPTTINDPISPNVAMPRVLPIHRRRASGESGGVTADVDLGLELDLRATARQRAHVASCRLRSLHARPR